MLGMVDTGLLLPSLGHCFLGFGVTAKAPVSQLWSCKWLFHTKGRTVGPSFLRTWFGGSGAFVKYEMVSQPRGNGAFSDYFPMS